MLFDASYRDKLRNCGLETTWPYSALTERGPSQECSLGARVETWYRALPCSDRTRFKKRLLTLDQDARHVIGAIAELYAREWLTGLLGHAPKYEPRGEGNSPDLVSDYRGTRIVCQVYAPTDQLAPRDLLKIDLERIARKMLGDGYRVSLLLPIDFRCENTLQTALKEQLRTYREEGSPPSWTGAHRLRRGNIEIHVKRRERCSAPTVVELVGFRSGSYSVRFMRRKLRKKIRESFCRGSSVTNMLFVLHAAEAGIGEDGWFKVLYGCPSYPVQGGPAYATAPTGLFTRPCGEGWQNDCVNVVVAGDWLRGWSILQVELVAYQNPHAQGELPNLPWSIPRYIPSRLQPGAMERVPPIGAA